MKKKLCKWKEYFKNLLNNPPDITDKPIQKIINDQLDVKLGKFEEKLDTVLEKIKDRKAVGLNEIPPEVWKTKFNNMVLWLCDIVYKQNSEKWPKVYILLFSKKGDLGITKNYRGITLTAVAANVQIILFLNCIWLEIEKILRKNQNRFQRNCSTTSQILTIHQISERGRAKNLMSVLADQQRFISISSV